MNRLRHLARRLVCYWKCCTLVGECEPCSRCGTEYYDDAFRNCNIPDSIHAKFLFAKWNFMSYFPPKCPECRKPMTWHGCDAYSCLACNPENDDDWY